MKQERENETNSEVDFDDFLFPMILFSCSKKEAIVAAQWDYARFSQSLFGVSSQVVHFLKSPSLPKHTGGLVFFI